MRKLLSLLAALLLSLGLWGLIALVLLTLAD